MNEPTSKDVFTLRKEGKLDDALILARQVYAADPHDEWNIKALFWVLYDLVKRSVAGKAPDLEDLVNEIKKIEVSSIRDQYIEKAETFLERLSLPGGAELFQARELSKSGNHHGSLKILRRLNRQYPGRRDIEESLGWELYRVAKDTDEGSAAVWDYLGEYSKLTSLHEPGLLHSKILVASLGTAKTSARLLDFVKWWDLDNLRYEDWDKHGRKPPLSRFNLEPASKPAKEFPATSLALRVARALYHNVKNFHIARGKELEWVAEFLLKVNEKEEDEYLPYYVTKMMTWAGLDPSTMRSQVIPLVRKKSTEYWIWDSLARTYDMSDVQYVQCFCKAAIGKAQEEWYKREVYANLALALADQREVAHASVAAEICIKLYEESGQAPPESVLDLTEQSWFTPDGKTAFEKFLSDSAAKAEQILCEDIKPTLAVISRVNAKKDVAVAAFTARQVGLLHYNHWPDARSLQEGDIIAAKADRTDDKAIILAWEKSDIEEIPRLYERYKGMIVIHHGNLFGFVNCDIGDIYVHPALIKEHEIEDQDLLEGFAINEWNKKKGREGWRAVTVEKLKQNIIESD